jgi:hypothetical protein
MVLRCAPMRHLRAIIGVGVVLGAAALGLTACGGGDETATTTPVTIGATNFVTLPPVQSTQAPITVAPLQPGDVLTADGSYIIQPGDYPSTIARDWGLTFDQLAAANGWTLDSSGMVPEWPGVGATIIIPAGARVPGETTGGTGTNTTAAPAPATTSAPVTTVDTCSQGKYVIEATDTSRQKVADKFDVSVEALDAANAGTAGYSAFYPGLEIVIPGKNC